jgi:hypothetical protein
LRSRIFVAGKANYWLLDFVFNIVLKPGPAWWVDPGPGRPGHGTGPGLRKNSSGTRPTQVNPAETRLIFHAFSLQLVEVPTDVEVIPCSAYALLTIEQQKRE